jgi:phosphoribosylanthranilate isomerase
MRVKICGITQLEQGKAIADLGATALGFICVPQSPRYVNPSSLTEIVSQLSAKVDCIGVFVNTSLEILINVANQVGLTGIQLHGDETSQFCQQLGKELPDREIIKALRIKTEQDLRDAQAYYDCVDTLLLDAYHPQLFGGTGHTINWDMLKNFQPPLPWLLAGGLNPDNILEALSQLKPKGIDLSSGVEIAPGNKDLNKVNQLFQQLLLVS